MNTKWEEQLIELTFDDNDYDQPLLGIHNAKIFIKDQITKAQQEIAEQIIGDIPNEIDDEYPNELLHIKQQLRDKWL